jgi:hypothetical protein
LPLAVPILFVIGRRKSLLSPTAEAGKAFLGSDAPFLTNPMKEAAGFVEFELIVSITTGYHSERPG